MKFTAEITLRTVPFEAENTDEARLRITVNPWDAMHPPRAQIIEVQVFEFIEEVDA